MTGVTVRTDLVDVYIFRIVPTGELQFLQLLRATEPMNATWQPVMGHIEEGETAIETALRELQEEVALIAAAEQLHALEQVHPYFLPRLNAVFLSPRFALRVDADWAPVLNEEHTDWRWTASADVESRFMWPGQWASIREIMVRGIDRR